MQPRVLAVTALLPLTLTACSGVGVMGPPGAPGPGSSQEFGPHRVQQALLDRDDVGGPFDKVDNDSNDSGVDSSDPTLGCVSSLDVLDNKSNDPADAARDFYVGQEETAAHVATAVISYRDADLADKAMDDLARGLTRCEPIDVEEDQGHFELEPTTDEDGWADGDRQINIGLTGTLTNANTRTRIGLQASAVRVAQNVVYVVLMDATDDFGDHPRELTEVAVARLRAVAADEEPPEPREVMDDYEPGDFGVTA